MLVRLDVLYHWSPVERRADVAAQGLRPGCAPNVAGYPLGYVCLGSTPSSAWALSGAMEWTSEIDEWDLWQVRLVDGDDIRVRPDFLPAIREVKVYGPIPADRVWHVGTRHA
jgi:hypothetical protein